MSKELFLREQSQCLPETTLVNMLDGYKVLCEEDLQRPGNLRIQI